MCRRADPYRVQLHLSLSTEYYIRKELQIRPGSSISHGPCRFDFWAAERRPIWPVGCRRGLSSCDLPAKFFSNGGRYLFDRITKSSPPRVLGLDIYVEVAAPHARIQARPRKVEECIGSGKGNIHLKTVPADDCGVVE